MRVGFVYDLCDDYLKLGYSAEETAEFDSAETLDGFAAAMERHNVEVVRVGNGLALAKRLANGERFGLVVSLAEGLSGRSREAQVPAICELFGQAYAFSDPLTMCVTLDKSVAKTLVSAAGVPTADFTIITAENDLLPGFGYPMFVKPVAEGTGKGCTGASCVADPKSLKAEVARLIVLYRQPVLVERYLPGREFTVGIIGTGADAKIIAVLELLISKDFEGGIYGYANKQSFGDHFDCRLATDVVAHLAGERALAAHRALGCRDVSRVDMRCDETGSPVFLEVNPIPGMKEDFSDLPMLAKLSGYSYDWLVGEILDQACRRYGLQIEDARLVQ